MQLRVFSNTGGKLLVEISHPLIAARKMWLLPMLSLADAPLKSTMDDTITVRFNNLPYKIPFLSIRTVNFGGRELLTQVGALDENSSRDVLNNVRDLLAWD